MFSYLLTQNLESTARVTSQLVSVRLLHVISAPASCTWRVHVYMFVSGRPRVAKHMLLSCIWLHFIRVSCMLFVHVCMMCSMSVDMWYAQIGLTWCASQFIACWHGRGAWVLRTAWRVVLHAYACGASCLVAFRDSWGQLDFLWR